MYVYFIKVNLPHPADVGGHNRFWLSCQIPLVYLLQKHFKLFYFTIFPLWKYPMKWDYEIHVCNFS